MNSIGSGAFYDCSGFSGNLVILEGVTEISDYAFCGCSGFSGNLVIPEGVTTIGKWAFLGCSRLSGNLVIPEGVREIGSGAFARCSGFSGELVIPEGVTSIGREVFYGCSGFSGTLEIPEGVTEIGNSAFVNCSGFSGNLVIPERVTEIGDYAFSGCDGITSVTVMGKETEVSMVISEYGGTTLGVNKLICGHPSSSAQTYAEKFGCTFIPLAQSASQTAVEITSTPDINVTVPMTDGVKLSLLSAVLADKELSGTTEETSLEITVSRASLQGTDRQAVDTFAAGKGMTPAQYMDISMKLHVGSTEQAVTRTAMPVRFVVDIPEELRQEDRKFAVVRLHDGQTELLEDLDDSPSTVTIETDRFSAYAMVYQDVNGAGSITGILVCQGSADAHTTLILTAADGSEAACTTTTGNSAAYTLGGVADGTYILQASRAGHTTREYTVTVTDGQAVRDVELWLTGDVDGSGSINAKDKKMLFEHMSGTPLTGYAFLVGDVDGSGSINAKDKKMLFNHMEGTEKLW